MTELSQHEFSQHEFSQHEFPKYFHLSWKSLSDWKIEFINNPPNNNYVNKIRLRKIKKDILVYGKIQDNFHNIGPNRVTRKLHNVPLLKSNLQKAVRLGKINEALVTGLNLIQMDFLSFIRRILIISLEDVGAIPDTFPLMTYLLTAYPNVEITNEIIHTLLLTVYRLTTYQKKHYPDTDNDVLDYNMYDYTDNIINSLIIASEYGGFTGDIKLYYRFINSTNRVILPIKTGKLVLSRTIHKNDIIPSAVDFHCYPYILNEISKNTNLDITTVKTLIWENSSSKNFRTPHTIKDKKVWNIVEKEYRNIVNIILRKLYLY